MPGAKIKPRTAASGSLKRCQKYGCTFAPCIQSYPYACSTAGRYTARPAGATGAYSVLALVPEARYFKSEGKTHRNGRLVAERKDEGGSGKKGRDGSQPPRALQGKGTRVLIESTAA